VSAYDRLRREPRTVADHTEKWHRMPSVEAATGERRAVLDHFCAEKRISVAALARLGARLVKRDDHAGYCLVFAGTNGNGRVTALKYRPLTGSSHDGWSENPSRWLVPIIVGNRAAWAWLIAEGETDGARLFDLVGDVCAILVLPTGAKVFKREWAGLIPRGAVVGVCHDADPDGDAGAELAARMVGGRVMRLRPPIEGGDWCDWTGDRAAFLELARQASAPEELEVVPLAEFVAVDEPGAEAILGSTESNLIPAGGNVMAYGDGGAGKTTLLLDFAFHIAACDDWLGMPVQRPGRVLWIEAEGPRALFRRKLRAKQDAWTGSGLGDRLRVWSKPWARFSFADAQWRAELAEEVVEHQTDVVIAGPLTRIGMSGAGTLTEVGAFMVLVDEVRAQSEHPLTVVLIHHENKGGSVSGAWEGAGDTLLHVHGAGNGHTTLFVQKARWSREHHRQTLKLAWTDGEGFEVEAKKDTLTLVRELLSDGVWRTAKQIAQALSVRPEAVREVVQDGMTSVLFEMRTGADAKALGRSSIAHLYQLASCDE
jgi:hypothetical protein